MVFVFFLLIAVFIRFIRFRVVRNRVRRCFYFKFTTSSLFAISRLCNRYICIFHMYTKSFIKCQNFFFMSLLSERVCTNQQNHFNDNVNFVMNNTILGFKIFSTVIKLLLAQFGSKAFSSYSCSLGKVGLVQKNRSVNKHNFF